jgi:hypothetical protein
MIHKIAFLGWIEHFSRPCVLFSDVDGVIQLPKMVKHRLEEPIIDDGQAQMLDIFLKFASSDGIFSCGTIKFLNG